jgi:predicted acyltransferase
MARATAVTGRLNSLDALRGFDMFWIMGAEGIFHSMAKITDSPFWMALSVQFEHLQWHGFHAYDLIFPLFLFIAGVATPYSIGSQLAKGTAKKTLLLRVIKRAFILVLLGYIVNNGLNILPLASIRFPSVLGRIGIAYMFANIIFLYAKERYQLVFFFAFLIGYWLLLCFTAAPNFPAGDLTIEGNFASYVDCLLLPGKLYNVIHDPEGILSTIPAISTALLGIFAGRLLKNGTQTQNKKTLLLIMGGIICVALGQIWNIVFPINKNLWTSSFTLYAGGISILLLAVFYYIIDVLGYRKWAFFFVVIGMNSILIYMSGIFIEWSYTTKALFNWLFIVIGDPYKLVAYYVCVVFVKWGLLYFLYKKKIFLRV